MSIQPVTQHYPLRRSPLGPLFHNRRYERSPMGQTFVSTALALLTGTALASALIAMLI